MNNSIAYTSFIFSYNWIHQTYYLFFVKFLILNEWYILTLIFY